MSSHARLFNLCQGSQRVVGRGGGQPVALRDRRVDAITFSSASTVRHVVEGLGSAGVGLERLPVETRPRIVCIGPVSAAAARECGLPVDGIADPSDDDGLIAALIRCFANRTALA